MKNEEEQQEISIEVKQQQLLDDIRRDKIFGFVKCDIHVPDHLIDKFSEYPPIFKNTEINIEDIGETMQAYCESIGRKNGVNRSLISSMHGKGIIILTPLLKWYLENGLVVDDVEYIIKYNPKTCFDWFMNQVCDERRSADIGGPEQKIIGEMFKLMGNNAYGGILMDKSKHTKTSFAKEKNLNNHTDSPFFKNHVELNGNIFEVTK